MTPDKYLKVGTFTNETGIDMTLYLEMIPERVVLSPGDEVELLARPSENLLPLDLQSVEGGIQIHAYKEFDPDWHVRFRGQVIKVGHLTCLAELVAAWQKVVSVTTNLIGKKLPFLEGVHQLADLYFEASNQQHDSDFMLFVAISSGADHLPSNQVRHLCSAAWLTECDTEIDKLEKYYEVGVDAACVKLISRFSNSL